MVDRLQVKCAVRSLSNELRYAVVVSTACETIAFFLVLICTLFECTHRNTTFSPHTHTQKESKRISDIRMIYDVSSPQFQQFLRSSGRRREDYGDRRNGGAAGKAFTVKPSGAASTGL